jgi:hypothetical protein
MTFRPFPTTAVFDWSGARGERHHGIALARCEGRAAPTLIPAPHSSGKWSRGDALAWLRAQADAQNDILIGMDVSMGFPFIDAGGYFPHWPDSPRNAPDLWAVVDRMCADDPHYEAGGFLSHPQIAAHFRQTGALGIYYGAAKAGRLRLVEAESRAQGLANPYSCLNLVGAAQVGKASLTAMRLLHAVRGIIPVWPFDPVPERGPMLVEIYTSIAAVRAGAAKGRSKLRTWDGLNAALVMLNCPPVTPLSDPPSDHDSDALLTAAWLMRAQGEAAHWAPAAMTNDVAMTEGWTFGVA